MRKIAIQNLKGGSGKTVTAINLTAALASLGNKVLLIDTDPQGSVGSSLGVRHEYSLYHLLLEDIKVTECIVHARENVDCVLSNKTLAMAEMQMMGVPRREELLRLRLAGLAGYDYVILDCSPSISLMHQNALLYADELLIPVSMDFLALLGATQILESVKFINKYHDLHLQIAGFLPTFVDMRTNITTAVLEALKSTYGNTGKILPPILVDANLLKAVAQRKTIFEYSGKSRAAECFMQVARILTGQEEAKEDSAVIDGAA
jgi:chromosome partitioning protein